MRALEQAKLRASLTQSTATVTSLKSEQVCGCLGCCVSGVLCFTALAWRACQASTRRSLEKKVASAKLEMVGPPVVRRCAVVHLTVLLFTPTAQEESSRLMTQQVQAQFKSPTSLSRGVL